jgi:hypothetical protein
VILLGLLLLGGYVAAPYVVHAVAPPAPPIVVEAACSDAPTRAPQLRVATLTPNLTSPVAMIPGRAPSPEMPGGTMFVSNVVFSNGMGQPMLHEWDVSRAQPVFTTEIAYDDPGRKIYVGNPSITRIAKGGDRVFVVTELDKGPNLQVAAFDFAGKPRGVFGFSAGTGASVVANEAWLVVAFKKSATADLEVHLVSTTTKQWREVAHVDVPSETTAIGQRPGALEMLDGRLYVVDRPSPGETRVSELELPSLKTVHTYSRFGPRSKTGYVHLASGNGRLHLLDRGHVVRLSRDLTAEDEHELATDELAIGPSGEELTPGGIGVARTRQDRVDAIGREASCTPAWAGPIPMLACSLDGQGARIARLPPSPRGRR